MVDTRSAARRYRYSSWKGLETSEPAIPLIITHDRVRIMVDGGDTGPRIDPDRDEIAAPDSFLMIGMSFQKPGGRGEQAARFGQGNRIVGAAGALSAPC